MTQHQLLDKYINVRGYLYVYSLKMLVYVWAMFIIGTYGLDVKHHYGSLLYNNLFENYNPKVRPVDDVDNPVDAIITLDLVKILALDEISQTFKVTVNIELEWTDKRLVWNVSDYGNIRRLALPLDKNIWVPDLMNYNAAYKSAELGMEYAFPNVLYNGFVFIWIRVNLETQCEIRTKKYPFDAQMCDIQLSTLGSTDDDVRINTTQNSAGLEYYAQTAEWAITNNYVDAEYGIFDGYPYRIISYHFGLKRTCTSCIVNTLLPIIILAILNFLSFFVPNESGEKLTFPMSVFLTLAVFLTIIMVSLPESVDGVSYLCTFVAFELGVSAATLLFTVITLRLHHEMGDRQIPHSARLMVRIFRRSCIADNRERRHITNEAALNQEIATGKTDLNENNTELDTGIYKEHPENQLADIKWKHVSGAFDMMMFLILLVTQLIASTVFLVVILI